MQTESGEHEDITKLLHDAFVRICQLALADCGVSVAELTLYLSVQLNTGVPQILSTRFAETVRSPLSKDNHHAECSTASGIPLLNHGPTIDNNKVDSHTKEKESFAFEHSFDSAAHLSDIETGDFITSVTVGSLTLLRTSSARTFSTAEDGQSSSCPLDVNPVHNLILSEDSRDNVPLEEFLADVGKSGECNKYVTESPATLLESGENTREVDHVSESSCTPLLNLVSSEESVVSVNDACMLSTLESYNTDILTQCTTMNCAEDIVYDSSGQCGTNDSSFLQDCHFSEDDTCSNSAGIAVESPFHDLCEIAEKTPMVDELSGSDDAEVEVERLSTSHHSSICSKTADRSAREGDTSYEEQLVVDESSSSSDAHSHSGGSTNSLCSAINKQPKCSEAVTYIQHISPLLKPHPVKCLPSTLCPDASGSSYFPQAHILSISTNNRGLVRTNTDAHEARETEFPNTLSSPSTKVTSIADAAQGRGLLHFLFFLCFYSHYVRNLTVHE